MINLELGQIFKWRFAKFTTVFVCKKKIYRIFSLLQFYLCVITLKLTSDARTNNKFSYYLLSYFSLFSFASLSTPIFLGFPDNNRQHLECQFQLKIFKFKDTQSVKHCAYHPRHRISFTTQPLCLSIFRSLFNLADMLFLLPKLQR